MTMNGVDLGLHGHTHNGQLWPYPRNEIDL